MQKEVDVMFFCAGMVVRGTRVFVELHEGELRSEYERLVRQAAAGWETAEDGLYLLRNATVYCGGVVTRAEHLVLRREAVLGGMRGAVDISQMDATSESITEFF